MAETNGVLIVGLAEFRAALRIAQGSAPRQLTAGLKRAGAPVLARASSAMPHRTGTLAGSLRTAVSGTKGDIISRVPYAGGAEWASRGKWSGFNRYGAAPRFVWPAIEAEQNQMTELIYQELRNVIEAFGWFH